MSYKLIDFENIIFNGFNYSLPREVIQNMMELKLKMGVQQTSTNDRKNVITSRNPRKQNTESTIGFVVKKPVAMIPNSIETNIAIIRSALNKMSKSNYETQTKIICDIISIYIEEQNNESLNQIASILIDVSSGNKFLTELIAKLYGELVLKSLAFKHVLNELLISYENSYKIDILRIADEDKRNKSNDKRKTTTIFICSLMKEQVIESQQLLTLLNKMIEVIDNYLDIVGHQYTIEEVSENIYLLVSECYQQFNQTDEWENIYDKFAKWSEFKSGDKKSFTNRAIFKYQALMDIL